MASFSVDEMDFIKCRGNDVCIYIDVLHDLKKLVFIICCYLVRLCFCTLTLVNASSERKTPQMRSHEWRRMFAEVCPNSHMLPSRIFAHLYVTPVANYSNLTCSHVLCWWPRLACITGYSQLPVLGCGTCCKLHCICWTIYALEVAVEGMLFEAEHNNKILSKLHNPLKYPIPYSKTKKSVLP